MKKEHVYKRLYRNLFVALLLLALIVPSVTAQAATEEGTLTIKKFRVEDYANLQESTGQRSDEQNVPTGAQTIADVEFQLEKLVVGASDTRVDISTLVDSSFPAKKATTNASGEAKFEGLEKGYYLVTQSVANGHSAHDERFVVRIPHISRDASGNATTNYDVVVYPKGQRVTVEKSVSSEKQVVGVGDIITWDVWYPLGPDLKREVTLQGTTTTTYGKNFYLTDEMDSRLDYVEGSVSFRYYDKNRSEIALTLSEGVDYHLPYDAATHVLTIQFTDNVGTKKVADANVAYIEMELDTRVNVSALDTVEVLWNNARIAFENTSGDPYEHEVFALGTSMEDDRVPKVYLGQIALTKVEAGDTSKRLAGATFYLADSRANAEAGKFLTREVDESGTREEITITTDRNGEASIKAIGAGTYYLMETEAPEGYEKLTEAIEVTVANDGNRNVARLEVSNRREGTSPGDNQGNGNGTGDGNGNGSDNGSDGPTGDGKPSDGGPPGGPNDGSGGKGFVGGVPTGDIVRMTGILLLAVASVGIVVMLLRREKKQEVRG